VIPDVEALIGNIIERLFADKGYRGYNARRITRSEYSSRAKGGG
jgi:hypothetical protein